MEIVEGGTGAEVPSVLSEKLLEEIGRGASSAHDSSATFSASPIIHAPSGEARAGYRVEPRVRFVKFSIAVSRLYRQQTMLVSSDYYGNCHINSLFSRWLVRVQPEAASSS